MTIRKFLRLDKSIIEFDNDVINGAGLIIAERKDFMKVQTHGCFGFEHNTHHEIICCDHSFSGYSHHSHNLNY